MAKKITRKIKNLKAKDLTVGLPWGLGSITFEADEVQQRAAWALYVELSTRVASQPLKDDEGVLREALQSIYSIFGITRQILREAGPEVANGEKSFGPVAIAVLNKGLRPFTARWHPLLKAHEDQCPEGVSPVDHERNWVVDGEDYHQLMRTELVTLQEEIAQYAEALAKISGAKHTIQGETDNS